LGGQTSLAGVRHLRLGSDLSDAGLPDKRGASNGRKYGIADFARGAFALGL
jgi:hypothetical protein